MSAVSKSVIPWAIAASTTDFACSKSIRGPKLFVPRPTTETSGPPCPSSLVRMVSEATGGRVRTAAMESLRKKRCGELSRMNDGQRLRRAGQGDVELSQAGVAAFLDDRCRLDDDDVVELQALRLARGEHG